jgi:hypothetical protein
MPPRMTNMHTSPREAYAHLVASAGGLAFVNDYVESAASPALYTAVAQRPQACPFAPLYHMWAAHT